MTLAAPSRTAIVSIDVETDWGGRLAPSEQHLRGVRDGLPAIQELLGRHGAPATWYVSGEIVPFIRSELREALSRGDELNSHAFTHRRLPELPDAELDDEISRSKAVLEDALGRPVHGFRAPQARIPEGLPRRLAGHGYRYDSSVFRGTMPTRFRNFDVPEQPYRQDDIWEVPVSKLPTFPQAMGLMWVDWYGLSTLRAAGKLSGWPELVHLYMHPFDVIPAYPMQGIPRGARLWYRRRPGSVLRTLDRLLSWLSAAGYRFATTNSIVKRAGEEFSADRSDRRVLSSPADVREKTE
jgi:peptidoglycan/xylan/chitin deacetylase (PgdA/CDA1 family)